MTELPNSIKTLRKQQHMTQDDLAAKLNVTRQTVSNYENGKSEPDIEMLVRIAEVFETDVNSLVNMEAAKPEADTPKHWGKAVGWVGLTVLCFFGISEVKEIAYEYAKMHYVAVYPYALVTFCYPACFALLGYSAMFAIKQFANLPAPKIWYGKLHTALIVVLLLNLGLYTPQIIWCITELLRHAGVLPIPELSPWDTLWPSWHTAAILFHPQICYTLYTLCGAGIGITETKNA